MFQLAYLVLFKISFSQWLPATSVCKYKLKIQFISLSRQYRVGWVVVSCGWYYDFTVGWEPVDDVTSGTVYEERHQSREEPNRISGCIQQAVVKKNAALLLNWKQSASNTGMYSTSTVLAESKLHVTMCLFVVFCIFFSEE